MRFYGREPGIGDQVGDYVLDKLIAEGGMGRVFKARQKTANIVVALKMIKAGRLANAATINAFLREAETVAKLDHGNIVPIYYVGVHNGLPYFSMKLFESGSLQGQLQRFEQDHRAAVRLTAAVARAVHECHEHGILHRDLKPANILLDNEDKPYVADFGLAKVLSEDAGNAPSPEEAARPNDPQKSTPKSVQPSDITNDARGDLTDRPADLNSHDGTRQGAFLGTKGYAAPENACVTHDSATVRADVFGLGAILYRLLTGAQLFDAEMASRWQYSVMVRTRSVPSPRAKNCVIDERLEAVCMKSLQTAPADRYATTADFAADLECYLTGQPPQAWKMPMHLRAWNAIRPYLVVSVLAMAIGIGLATAVLLWFYFDPERLPRQLERRTPTSGHVDRRQGAARMVSLEQRQWRSGRKSGRGASVRDFVCRDSTPGTVTQSSSASISLICRNTARHCFEQHQYRGPFFRQFDASQ